MTQKILIPEDLNFKQRLQWLKKNEYLHIAQKKAILKTADAISMTQSIGTNKNVSIDVSERDSIEIVAAINTTKLLDSHGDVHIDGLWKKSLSENKNPLHLKQHRMDFDEIIADGEDLKAFTKVMSWKELGFDFEGNTEVLLHELTARKDRHENMFNQYANGRVKNHSVGMQYVKLTLCLNDEDEGANFDAWEKYYPLVVNKDEADKQGYFWAITEAKYIEGSAVPKGSNWGTPTISIKNEPHNSTHKNTEPSNDTQVNDFFKHLNKK